MNVVEYWHGTIKNYRYDGYVSGPQARPGGLCPPRWPPAPPLFSINTPIFQKP